MGFTIPRIKTTIVLVDGTAQTIELKWQEFPTTVFARPAVGDTVTITYSCDGGITYTNWPSGGVTTYTEDVLDAPITHLKGQRTTGSGTTSAFGVC